LAAHLFIFYFGVIADLTPPVAGASIAAAGISGGSFVRTGFIAVRLAIAGFIVPFIFALDPGLLCINSTIGHTLVLVFYSLAGVLALGSAAGGYLLDNTKIYERIILIISAFALLNPGSPIINFVGVILLVGVLILQKLRIKSKAKLNVAVSKKL